MIKRSLIEI